MRGFLLNVLYILLLLSGFITIMSLNRIFSILGLISCFMILSIYLIIIDHKDFTGLVILMIYVGSVLVFFLFTTMTLGKNFLRLLKRKQLAQNIFFCSIFYLVFPLNCPILFTGFHVTNPPISRIGFYLLTIELQLFIYLGLLLLIVLIVIIIMLSKYKKQTMIRQEQLQQTLKTLKIFNT